jgi:hypothetical protein
VSKVIKFKQPEPKEPHGSGEAFCMNCRHEWIAVVPVGITRFECPRCHSYKGMWKFEFMPEVGSLMRLYNCGNDLFRLTPDGHQCANCGVYQEYE